MNPIMRIVARIAAWRAARRSRSELAEIAAYLVPGGMSVKRLIRFEERRHRDAGFRAMVDPFLAMWHLPMPDPAFASTSRAAADWRAGANQAQSRAQRWLWHWRQHPGMFAMLLGLIAILAIGASGYGAATLNTIVAVVTTPFTINNRNIDEGRALVWPLMRDTVVVETGWFRKTLTIGGNTTLTLLPHSRFTYDGSARKLQFGALDGEAVIRIPEGTKWSLGTNGSSVSLHPGTYAVRSVIGSKEGRISIESGRLYGGDPGQWIDGPRFVITFFESRPLEVTTNPVGFPRIGR